MSKRDTRPSPYRGFWVVLLILILVPVVLCLVIKAALDNFSPFSPALDWATAKTFGFGMGFVFHMICLVGGVFRSGWNALKYRISEFFENLVVGVGYAFQTYFEDIHEDGMTFTICMAIIAANLALAIHSLLEAIALFI